MVNMSHIMGHNMGPILDKLSCIMQGAKSSLRNPLQTFVFDIGSLCGICFGLKLQDQYKYTMYLILIKIEF